MRLLGIGLVALTLVACGGGGTPANQDAGVPVPQTGKAAAPVPADYSCLGARDDCTLIDWQGATCPPAPGFTVGGIVQDFQSKDNIVDAVGPNAVATVTVYETTADVLSDTPLAGPVQSDSSGRYTVTIPKSLTRVIFKTTMADSMDTYEFSQLVKADETDNDRYAVANSTGDFMNAWVGIAFDKTKGGVAGALRDCKYAEVANASGAALDPATGAAVIPDEQIFYFNDAAGLPVKRSKRTYSDFDGRILFLNVPPTAGGVRIQAFANLAGTGTLERIAEAVVPVLANSIVIADLDPLALGQ